MLKIFHASCKCGSLGYRFSTAIPPFQWQVRKCICSFCSEQRNHLHVSDPSGQVSYQISGLANLHRYQFSTKTADFLTCSNCNIYLGAIMSVQDTSFAVLNAEIIDLPMTLAKPILVSFDGETAKQRIRRRSERWTPVVGSELLLKGLKHIDKKQSGNFQIQPGRCD